MNNANELIKLQEYYNEKNYYEKILNNKSCIDSLRKMQGDFEKMKKSYRLIGVKLKTLENEYSTVNGKMLEKNDDREKENSILYSSETGNNIKIIEGTHSRVMKIEKEIEELQDEKGSILNREEELLFKEKKVKVRLQTIKEEFYELKNKVHEERKEAKEKLKSIYSNIEKLRKLVPENLLQEFDKLIENKKVAVTFLIGEVCQGCKMNISRVLLENVKNGNGKIYHCENCGRIIFHGDI